MSGVNWNYFKRVQMRQVLSGELKRPAPLLPRAEAQRLQRIAARRGTNEELASFVEYEEELADAQKRRVGRAWRVDELRLKSHDDLHKLWYVLLKEKNKLKSEQLVSFQLQQYFFRYSDIMKVSQSMARLLTVVHERKKIRALYRAHLEDQYIADKKQLEMQEFLEKRDRIKARYDEAKVPMTSDELREHLNKRDYVKTMEIKDARESIQAEIDSKAEAGGSQLAPGITSEDLDFLATTKTPLSQKDILRMYVGNWAELNLKQRRKVFGYVQAQRAKHAKQIFIKELSAIGRKLDRQGSNILVEGSRLKGHKDPLKLRLESITL